MTNTAEATKQTGGCHCGAVRFEVVLDPSNGSRCNCTVCTKTSTTNGITKPANFTLVAGEDSLATYAWGAETSKRFFCKKCGVHCFGKGFLEEVGGDFVSVNMQCLDGFDITKVKVIYWDGRHDNWHAGPRETPWVV